VVFLLLAFLRSFIEAAPQILAQLPREVAVEDKEDEQCDELV